MSISDLTATKTVTMFWNTNIALLYETISLYVLCSMQTLIQEHFFIDILI